jgi:hypothetical protein
MIETAQMRHTPVRLLGSSSGIEPPDILILPERWPATLLSTGVSDGWLSIGKYQQTFQKKSAIFLRQRFNQLCHCLVGVPNYRKHRLFARGRNPYLCGSPIIVGNTAVNQPPLHHPLQHFAQSAAVKE